jgi:CRISPR/Cas system CMR-associated protein Cmr1 (group 7 of RAMP superfamily)
MQRRSGHGQTFNSYLTNRNIFIMKKIITILGSLFVFAGLKAQTITTVKKETVKPLADTSIVLLDSTQKQLKGSSINQASPALKKTLKTTFKTTNPAFKLPLKDATKPVKG